MNKAKKWDMWVIISIALLGIYILFMLYPMIKLLVNSVRDEDTGEEFAAENGSAEIAFSHPREAKLFWISLKG